MKCPCGSRQEFSDCCEPFIKGAAIPDTAEKLMRSRYSAYTQADIDYIKRTSSSAAMKDFDEKGAREWAQTAEWRGLKILDVKDGGVNDKKGVVEFMATYAQDGKVLEHHETSVFKKNSKGHWQFEDGDSHTHEEGQGHHHHHGPVQPIVREGPKVGRNDPCPCGSGKKYKKCCGAAA